MTHNADSQSAMTPASALAELVEGSQRFSCGSCSDRTLLDQVSDTKSGQWPFAAVVSCIDSRASVELILDQGIGDVFSARIAGNFVNEDILGSLEFACKVAGAKLVVVLGHTHCGAVKGACDDVKLGNLTTLLEKLAPAVAAIESPAEASERTSANPAFVQSVAECNVHRALDQIRERSSILAEMESNGEIGLVGGMYDIETGKTEFYPSQSTALA